MKRTDRRKFIKKLAAGSMAVGASSEVLAKNQQLIEYHQRDYKAVDKVRVAGIGMGIMGFNNCNSTVKVPGVEMVAACDLYDGRLTRSKEVFGKDLFTTRDYREVLDRDDIDAVIISTSDHWHDKIAIEALNKGMSVYCEKPMVHKINEGRAVLEAEARSKGVLQVGSQRVSSLDVHKAKELLQSGAIGDLIVASISFDRHDALGAWQYSMPTDASPQTVDWDAFIGDAPKRKYDKTRFFRWRNYEDYGTGVAGDLFVHMYSAMHVITGSLGPSQVHSMGGLRYWKDGRDAPDVMLCNCAYDATDKMPAYNMQIRVNFIDGAENGSVFSIVGTEGVIEMKWGKVILKQNKLKNAPGYGGWDSFETFSEAQQADYVKWYNATYPKEGFAMEGPKEFEYLMPKGYDAHYEHHANFYDAIRNGMKVVEDGSFGFRAAAPALMANMSYYEKKTINWDPVAMKLL